MRAWRAGLTSTRPEISEFLKALDETQYLSPARLQRAAAALANCGCAV
jgi:hypothetical protein